jgi:hypothetical protein
MASDQEKAKPDDGKKARGPLGRLRRWLAGQLAEMDAAEKDIERQQKELKEKIARGTRRTDGRI